MPNISNPLRLSVIVNNYNYGQYLKECIDSVLTQTRPADEIIFVDDGSTDNSLKVVLPYKDRIKIISQKNSGQLRAITTGAEAATGDILLFLDSDDKWKDNHLKVIESTFNSRPQLGCLFTCLDFFDKNDGPHPSTKLKHPPEIIESKIITYYLNRFLGRPTSASAFRSAPIKQVLNACTALGDDFKVCADKVLSQGASLLGMSKLFVEDSTVYYRAHESNAFYRANGRPDSQKQENRHRSELIRRNMQLAFPFKTNADAIVLEFKKNKKPELFGVFYKEISNIIQPSKTSPNPLKSRLKTEAKKLKEEKHNKTTKPPSKIASKISKKRRQLRRFIQKLKS
jgi:glycosyltransferase involved in cell wall biosynthesis